MAGVFTNTVFGFLLAYVLRAVYTERPLVGPFDVTDAVTFTFVAQGLLMPLGLFSTTEIAERIKTGDVIVDLQRPFDHQAWWGAVDYGKAGFYLLFRGIPPFLAGAIVFDLRLPAAPTFLAFLGAVGIAIGISFAWMLQVPIEVWLGQHQGIELLEVYAAQLAWLLALVAIGRVVLRRAVRRVVVQGG